MFHVVQGAADTGIIHRVCNAVTYSNGDPYANSVGLRLLADIVTVTLNHTNYDYYYTTSPYATEVYFGHATCNPTLSYSDCGTCVSAAMVRILADCPHSLGVDMGLKDCSMRYESDSFTD
ncbi:uncharacterized protein J3R85_011300 [Psidium guajava]|nr:uncharacterized protein J3R85_011300 [Psidium guajava]